MTFPALNPSSTAPAETKGRLKFIVVGASIAASGHSVLVLEESQIGGGPDSINGAARVPPNGFKILSAWGLETEIRDNAVVGDGHTVYKYDPKGKEGGRDYIGIGLWDPQLLVDARGAFLQIRHKELLRILYDKAVSPSSSSSKAIVTVLFDSEVTSIECEGEKCSVTLRTGETHEADGIIGADGASGFVRRWLMDENADASEGTVDVEGDAETDGAEGGIVAYMTAIPKSVASEHEVLKELYQHPQRSMVATWLGDRRGAKGKDRDVLLWLYAPDENICCSDSWTRPAENHIKEVMGTCDIMLQSLAEQAGASTCVRIRKHVELKSWVSKSGRVLAVGDAAHAFPPMSLHSCSVAIEDGAFIGRLFSHTQDVARIPEFFHAFEDCRKPRASYILQAEHKNIAFICMPDGPKQVERDASLRANHAAGRSVLDAPRDEDMHKIWEDLSVV
ncbi:hypothetical protein FB45DRAFT_1037437 [Roridomyces roridus]|uniref:FAD-binding domain-containing protein n=1 Tax=Roridomyces roridus TaxID=1738132 RepID=A0AAD7B6Y3_9AGAR|nr:hypothetical protein FB45DRAFT_1037437 [Roridomyces roridus]